MFRKTRANRQNLTFVSDLIVVFFDWYFGGKVHSDIL